jgi:hypothetical protein
VQQLPLDKQAQLITSVTRTTTYFALKQSIQSNAKRVEVAQKIVNVIIKIQGDPSVSVSNPAIIELLSRYFPSDYVILFQNALDILQLYYDPKIDIGQTIGEDNLVRLNAFLDGVLKGAQMVVGTQA